MKTAGLFFGGVILGGGVGYVFACWRALSGWRNR